ncbi:MAG: hypothetical protein DRJ03_17985 [Chloroflexi bacterium]|nr:MAG: hypothetical protein DRJ03_17985 [Chloroflexota bacterium]HEY73541.1 hypothetical protein [Thermoflexia bacterium]
MNKAISTRIWAIAGVGMAVVAGLGLLLAFLGRGPTKPSSAIPPPSQPDDPIVASVDGSAISQLSWQEAVLLDQVLSGLAGQSAPTPDETLQRLINEELVLQATSEQEPTAEQVETQIAALQQAWGVGEDAVTVALERVGLTHAAFEQAIGRLLKAQAGLSSLENQGHDTAAWLEKQRASADIQIFESAAVLPVPTTQSSPIPTSVPSPLPTPAAETPAATPTFVLATALPLPAPPLADLEFAPDFTLERAGGGVLTLTEQLAQGPVVLVFFQKCG